MTLPAIRHFMPDKKYILSCLVLCGLMAVSWPSVLSAATAKEKYFKAESCYGKLLKNPQKQRYRESWLSCIEKFQAVYRHNPSGPWAAAGLYMSGKLYGELYARSYKLSDREEALNIFQGIIKDFPKSQYRHKAAEAIRTLSHAKRKEIPTKKARHTKARLARVKRASPREGTSLSKTLGKKAPESSVSKKSTVQGVRFWSNPSYTRVVVDMDGEAPYTHRLLKKDASIHKPQRLYVDIRESRLGTDIKKLIPIENDLLSGARVGQHTPDSVRVVVDIKSIRTYNIFSLQNPFRIVMDVWGQSEGVVHAKRPLGEKAKRQAQPPAGVMRKGLALGVKRIAIDAGHGGDDFGASGHLDGVYEKDITLQIAMKLAQKLRQSLQCEVVMTRDSDRYLAHEERTAIANTKDADLFISIHTNAHMDSKECGIETYFLNLATDEEAVQAAARENATSRKNISDLEGVLSKLMGNVRIGESRQLADHVHESLIKHMSKRYSRVKDRGVKQAPFYVLLGAQMPAIFIGTSFITNPRECKRLLNADYQDQLCEGIVNGVRKYIEVAGQRVSSSTSPAPSPGVACDERAHTGMAEIASEVVA